MTAVRPLLSEQGSTTTTTDYAYDGINGIGSCDSRPPIDDWTMPIRQAKVGNLNVILPIVMALFWWLAVEHPLWAALGA